MAARTVLARIKTWLLGFVLGVTVRMLVTLPLGWFVYAFGFAASKCDSVITAQCLTFALGAPVGYVTMLGLAAEEPPDYPDALDAWLVALAVAIVWMTIDLGLDRRRKSTSKR